MKAYYEKKTKKLSMSVFKKIFSWEFQLREFLNYRYCLICVKSVLAKTTDHLLQLICLFKIYQ